MSAEAFFKNGWSGVIVEHRGVPVGTFIIRARKGDRVFNTPPMTAEQVETFDPDKFWKTP